MRPRGVEYQRFIHLVDRFRGRRLGPGAAMLAVSPFRVADIATNAILLRAERDLLALADAFGNRGRAPGDRRPHRRARRRAIAGLWSPERGLFTSRDLVDGAALDVGTSAGFLPLYARATTPEQAAALAATLDAWAARVALPRALD